MINSLIKLALFLVVGILIYNFIFGTSEEKAQSKEVFQKTGAAVSSAWSLLKSERQKFDAGKYDKALDQLGGAYREIRDKAQYVDEKVLRRLSDLEERKANLEKELEEIEDTPPPAPAPKKGVAKPTNTPDQSSKAADQQQKKEKLMRELDQLMNDTDQLLKQAQK